MRRRSIFSDLLNGDKDLGDRVAPVENALGQVGDAVDATADVDESLSGPILHVAAVHLAGGAGDVGAKLVVGLSACRIAQQGDGRGSDWGSVLEGIDRRMQFVYLLRAEIERFPSFKWLDLDNDKTATKQKVPFGCSR